MQWKECQPKVSPQQAKQQSSYNHSPYSCQDAQEWITAYISSWFLPECILVPIAALQRGSSWNRLNLGVVNDQFVVSVWVRSHAFQSPLPTIKNLFINTKMAFTSCSVVYTEKTKRIAATYAYLRVKFIKRWVVHRWRRSHFDVLMRWIQYLILKYLSTKVRHWYFILNLSNIR